ncbi:MAG: hypothetical protein AAFV53_09460 [Myxococcota bacterium]
MRRVGMMVGCLLAGCQLNVPIPAGTVDEIAREVSQIGHPAGKYVDSRVVGVSSGWFSAARSLDIAIDYKPAIGSQKEMKVRFYIDSISPCEVRTEVLSDTGPTPLLLDNQIASPLVGQMVCDIFNGER